MKSGVSSRKNSWRKAPRSPFRSDFSGNLGGPVLVERVYGYTRLRSSPCREGKINSCLEIFTHRPSDRVLIPFLPWQPSPESNATSSLNRSKSAYSFLCTGGRAELVSPPSCSIWMRFFSWAIFFSNSFLLFQLLEYLHINPSFLQLGFYTILVSCRHLAAAAPRLA